MSSVNYIVVARDPSSTPPNTPLTGLTPSWVFLKRFSDGAAVTPPPITEVGFGQYKLAYDPEASGEVSGQIDLGASIYDLSSRLVDVAFYLNDSRTVANLDAPVSSRSTFTGGPVAGVAAPVAVSAVNAGAITAASFAANAVDNNALAQSAADKSWTSATRTLTAMTTGPVVTYLATDTATQGNWRGVYGADGFDLALDPSLGNPSLPSYASVTVTGASDCVWNSSTSDNRALQNVAGTTRLAACWYSSGQFNIQLYLTDGKSHRVTVYALDWDNSGPRSQRFDVVDASGNVLDTRTLSGFQKGQYVSWVIPGPVTIRVTNLVSGSNAVVSGIFFG
jgi:hypothetical protein